MPPQSRGRRKARLVPARGIRAPLQKPLYRATDYGHPITIDANRFAPSQRDGGWGPFAESFERLNGPAVAALDVHLDFAASSQGTVVRLVPGGKAGAIPLRSAQTGHVAAGLLIEPRFGWAGVGAVLSQTGWHAMPDFPHLPLVPGSARAVPPWVLAGPVLARLAALLGALRRSFQDTEAVLRSPRGRVLWGQYRTTSLVRGHWDRLPCRFPDLDADPQLRREIRWATERIRRDLVLTGGTDPIAVTLASMATQILSQLANVEPLKPKSDTLQRFA